MLLPREISKKEFSHAVGGYARDEVKSYLEYIADNYEKLRRENDELSRRLDAAMEKLDQYELAASENAADESESNSCVGGESSSAAVAILEEVVSSLRSELDEISSKLNEAEKLVFGEVESANSVEEPETVEETVDEIVEAVIEETAIDEISDEAISEEAPPEEIAEIETETVVFDIPVASAEVAPESREEIVFNLPDGETFEAELEVPEQPDMDEFMADFFDVDGDGKHDEEEPEVSEPEPEPTVEAAPEKPQRPAKARFHLAKKQTSAKASEGKSEEPAEKPERSKGSEGKSEDCEESELEAILNALKVRYDSATDEEESEDDFDMTNIDEFSMIFGDSSSSIEKIPTGTDIDADLLD